MLKLLDGLLQRLLLEGVPALQPPPPPGGGPAPAISPDQVRFRPPDADWRTEVQALPGNALNVYLVELRENRKLRSNERFRTVKGGVVHDEPAPTRLDCHYLISAWHPSQDDTTQTLSTFDEHRVLYEAAAVLLRNSPLNPSRVYTANPATPNEWPSRHWNTDLPTVVAPPDGYPKLAEFWASMGEGHRWKVVLYLIVTVPVELVLETAGWIVTTKITGYQPAAPTGATDTWVQVGGLVLNAQVTPPVPVVGARVDLLSDAGVPLQTAEAGEAGRFDFVGLSVGRYQLRAYTPTLGASPPTVVDVPSATGAYDVRFT